MRKLFGKLIGLVISVADIVALCAWLGMIFSWVDTNIFFGHSVTAFAVAGLVTIGYSLFKETRSFYWDMTISPRCRWTDETKAKEIKSIRKCFGYMLIKGAWVALFVGLLVIQESFLAWYMVPVLVLATAIISIVMEKVIDKQNTNNIEIEHAIF